MVLVRQEIGEVLRDVRLQKGRTLRQVASRASVALGYLSEVERGQKEASSEILASVAYALDTPISVIMREVGDRLAIVEGLSVVPDTLPDEMVAEFDADLRGMPADSRSGAHPLGHERCHLAVHGAVPRQQVDRHAEQAALQFGVVGDDRSAHNGRGSRHAHELGRDRSPGQRLGDGHSQTPLRQRGDERSGVGHAFCARFSRHACTR